ncbi:uncharacterized protein LOC143015783 isoform X4 [Genypterus blacodes]|uniref:uncharacterized protein LOC143015783 isoform X4 n=1 Tax=Genypterus blacodes TaxID=154954 RepID=UPI003F76F7C1
MDQRYFLCFLCIFTHRPVAGLTPQYVLRGQNVTLTPSISGPPEQILWKHEGDKVIEFDGREEKVYSTYKNRITLDWHSAEIIIKDLQHNDTGEYELEAIINKKLVHAQHKVVVLDEVSEPTISCAMMDVSHSNRSKPDATLLCSFDPGRRPSVMKFEWESHGATKARPELNISLEGRQDESVYTCRVSNPLSTKTATFTAKDCYQVAGLTPQYVLRGQNVTLTPSISGPPEQILWKHEGDKVIEFDGREEKVYSTYKNRITLDWHSAEIIIKDLQHNDTGEYELEAIINKKLVHAQHKVVVLDEVSKPTISCAMMDVSHSNRSKPNATLLCSFDLGRRPSVMKFEWESHGATKARPELNISLAGRQDESVYTCRVSNPLSTKTATFTAKDCYQDESSPVGLIAGLVVGLLLLLIIICAALWFFRLKRSQKGLPCIERGDGRKTRSEDFAETPGLVDNHTKKPPEDIPQVLLNKTRLHEEKQPLLDRSDTLPSPQRLHGLDQRHPHTDPKDPANTHNEEAESDLITVTPTDPELPESEAGERNEPDSDGEVNDQQSDPESPATPEQPVNVTEKRQHFESLTPNPNKHGVPQKKTPLRQEKQCLLDTSDTLPSPQRLHGLDQRHPHTGPKDPANTHNEEAESDLVPVNPTDPELPESEAGEGNEPDSDGEVNDQQSDPKSPATPEQPVVVPFEAGERNEPDVEDITEDQQSDPQSSATPEQPETLELVANQTNSPVIVSHKGSVKGKAKRYDDMVTNADKQEDPEKKTPQREEKRPPLDRSNTLPSLQSLSGLDQSPPHTHPEDPANTHNEEAESDLDTITPADPELPESEAGERNEPDSDEEVKEQQSDPESPATPEQPVNVTEKRQHFESLTPNPNKHGVPQKKTPLRQEKQCLLDTSDTLPSPQRLHGLDQRHPHTGPKDPANTHNEEAESDLVPVNPTDPELPESEAGEGNEPDSDGEVNDQQSDPKSPATPEQPVVVPFEAGERNEPDVEDITEDQQSDPQSSATPEQPETLELVANQTNSPVIVSHKGSVKGKAKRYDDMVTNADKQEDPEKKTPQREEKRPPLDRSNTLPSLQSLSGLDQSPPHTHPEDPANTHNEEAESDLDTITPADPELPESEAGERNEPDSDEEVKEQQSDPQSSATPEQPETLELVANQTNSPVIVSHKGSVKGKAKRYDDMVTNADKQEDPEKKTPQREEKRPPLDRSNTLPSLQSLSGLDQSPPHTHPEDPANTHNEEAESDLDTITPADPELPESEAGERNEPDSDEEVKDQQSDPESPATPEQPGSEEKAGDDGRPHSTPYTEPAETSSEPNEGVEPEQLGGKPTEVKLPESGSADSGKKDESESESDDKSPNADAKQHKEDPDSDQVATRLPEESHPESDSSGISVTNEPEPGEELQLSAAPEQSEPQITPAEPESNPSQ